MTYYRKTHNPLDQKDVERGVLQCPSCGTEYTHQYDVQVFARDEDDERERHTHIWGTCNKYNSGIHTEEIDNDRTTFGGNPSPRRDGITIGFLCENCENNKFFLDIYQHKGQTFMETRDVSHL